MSTDATVSQIMQYQALQANLGVPPMLLIAALMLSFERQIRKRDLPRRAAGENELQKQEVSVNDMASG
jgi:hypothetical protein